MANIKVRRANVVLYVPEYQKDEYLAKGYDVIGADGKVIEKTIPNDINSLKIEYGELLKKVELLEAENAELKKQLNSSQNDEADTEEDPEDFTPINKRNSKKKK